MCAFVRQLTHVRYGTIGHQHPLENRLFGQLFLARGTKNVAREYRERKRAENYNK